MSAQESSFYRLFSRSRSYRYAVVEEGSAEEKEAIRQRERFAVAALAFCLRHDEEFLRSFWSQVCKVSDDPAEMPLIRSEDILLEPPLWADLRLISDTDAGRLVWVVEVKAGASLSQKQNPNLPDFCAARTGYGALFCESENASTKLRYIVLGARESLGLPKRHGALPISLRQSSWEDVATCTASRLVRDLFDCFALLQLQPFAMNQANTISVSHGLSGVGNAVVVLSAVSEWLGAQWREKNLTAYKADPGAAFGIHLTRLATPQIRFGNLQTICGGPKFIAWIGYLAGATDEIIRSVWLYFDSVEKRDAVLAKVQVSFPIALAASDAGEPCIAVEMPVADNPKDFEWFKAVFAAAGVS